MFLDSPTNTVQRAGVIRFYDFLSNPEEILITIDILKELRDSGIGFVQLFTDLGRMLGAEGVSLIGIGGIMKI